TTRGSSHRSASRSPPARRSSRCNRDALLCGRRWRVIHRGPQHLKHRVARAADRGPRRAVRLAIEILAAASWTKAKRLLRHRDETIPKTKKPAVLSERGLLQFQSESLTQAVWTSCFPPPCMRFTLIA